MHDQTTPSVPLGAAMAALGPAALGVVIGLPSGLFAAAHDAISIPILVFCVTLLMVPALYVATAVAGIAPRGFGRSVARGLRACGVAMLGFVPPAAFLVATGGGDPDAGVSFVVGGAVLGASILIGLRALYRSLFPEKAAAVHMFVYIVWSSLALIIGMLFYGRALHS